MSVCDELLREGADVNRAAPLKENATPLHFAALNGHAEVARLLIQHGAKIDAESKRGRTALMTAAALGRVGVVRVLWISEPT